MEKNGYDVNVMHKGHGIKFTKSKMCQSYLYKLESQGGWGVVNSKSESMEINVNTQKVKYH